MATVTKGSVVTLSAATDAIGHAVRVSAIVARATGGTAGRLNIGQKAADTFWDPELDPAGAAGLADAQLVFATPQPLEDVILNGLATLTGVEVRVFLI